MGTRLAVVLIVIGAILAIAGTILAVAFQGYELFGHPLLGWQDVAAPVAIAVLGLILVVVGVRGLVRARGEGARP